MGSLSSSTLSLFFAAVLLAPALQAAELPLPVKFHAAPKPLAAGAVTQDWPRFLGPAHNCTSTETHLLHTWPAAGPTLVWDAEKGLGHGAPSIVGERLFLFHRWQGRERIDCLQAETGKALWAFAYDAPYQDRMGSGDGPRTSPAVAEGRVFTYGVTGQLHGLDAATGVVLWRHDCEREFSLEQNFFGHGGTPLAMGSRVIVQLGGADQLCAAAFDAATGRLLWKAKHAWGASYASPVPATLHGRECVLIFAGGESRPPTGGLLVIDVATGEVLSAIPHRAEMAESVNASSPAVSGDRVFVTEAYGSGGAMVQIAPDFKPSQVWEGKLGAHFMTPLFRDKLVIGCNGQSPRLAELICHDAATGRELWTEDLGGRFGRTNLLSVDDAVLCLGEFGDLAWLQVSASGAKIVQRAKLFNAPDTWSLPAISRGLLYICQNERSQGGQPARVLCYDLRGE